MSDKRPCPHCSPCDRDMAPLGEWRCHTRNVGRTPTRDSFRYPWGRLADHGTSGLYDHGPDDSLASLYEMMTEELAGEQIDLDPEFGVRLHLQQKSDARRNVVQFLALSPHLWQYVRFAMVLAGTPVERKAEIRQWLAEARRMRDKLVKASRVEALRLARV